MGAKATQIKSPNIFLKNLGRGLRPEQKPQLSGLRGNFRADFSGPSRSYYIGGHRFEDWTITRLAATECGGLT